MVAADSHVMAVADVRYVSTEVAREHPSAVDPNTRPRMSKSARIDDTETTIQKYVPSVSSLARIRGAGTTFQIMIPAEGEAKEQAHGRAGTAILWGGTSDGVKVAPAKRMGAADHSAKAAAEAGPGK